MVIAASPHYFVFISLQVLPGRVVTIVGRQRKKERLESRMLSRSQEGYQDF
jgi:hypothetical protein